MTRIVLIGLLTSLPLAAALEPERLQEIFAEANDLFRQANEKRETDPAQAYNLYQAASLRYERLIREGDVRNGRLYYNLGNAYFQMGDLGRAILSYRRAELLVGGDPDLRQSLRYARSRRLDRFDRTTERRVLETLLFWHYDIPTSVRLWLFAACWAGLWGGLAWRLLHPGALGRIAPLSLGAASLLLGGSLGFEAAAEAQERHVVVTALETTARRGDGANYEPAFRDPLHAGAELELLEERDGWMQVRLPDGRSCWIQRTDAEAVRPLGSR